mmetsp:Transcript_11985/g.12047  ORF Transcript_11985/g.12047 Transcript_11985/m.12047 type:complete len:93 (-) Transcript_11985:153-431(-)|eukprot:CAMPEP_0182418166 /NCGR_PEP_ID=MMETSP1167-20130531/2637_1 /TAXON_ID=2988 /ORGANISM="Mallomonas Sp, Strain CCMP3275" /LENGTH=92 /DNA_ID=CAMNT_0024592215 /DNA_START=71 /DNA_END=349 /DNA_ORIENTATION=+
MVRLPKNKLPKQSNKHAQSAKHKKSLAKKIRLEKKLRKAEAPIEMNIGNEERTEEEKALAKVERKRINAPKNGYKKNRINFTARNGPRAYGN